MANYKEQRKTVEKRWREEKYKVMYYNQNQYNHIRELLKDEQTDLHILDKEIALAYSSTPSRGSMLNSFQHMWGYFKKKTNPQEKAYFLELASDVEENNHRIIQFLSELAVKYDVNYLKESTILDRLN